MASGEEEPRPEPKLTEADVLRLLRDRLTRTGNGGADEHAFLTHVRNGAGFNSNRTFDAVAVNLWPSRGLTLDVYEVKVSRSDWQRELKKPDKAEDACTVADRFWIAAPAGVVRDGELPPTWGLIEVVGDGLERRWALRQKTSAPLLTSGKQETISRSMLVGLLRSCPGAIPGGKVPAPRQADLDAASLAGYERGRKDAQAKAQRVLDEAAGTKQDLFDLSAALRCHGLDSFQTSLTALTRHAPAVARAVKGDLDDRKVSIHMKSVRSSLAAAIEAIDAVSTSAVPGG